MIGAKLKIALLYDVWNEDPVAAAAKEEEAPARKPRKKMKTGSPATAVRTKKNSGRHAEATKKKAQTRVAKAHR